MLEVARRTQMYGRQGWPPRHTEIGASAHSGGAQSMGPPPTAVALPRTVALTLHGYRAGRESNSPQTGSGMTAPWLRTSRRTALLRSCSCTAATLQPQMRGGQQRTSLAGGRHAHGECQRQGRPRRAVTCRTRLCFAAAVWVQLQVRWEPLLKPWPSNPETSNRNLRGMACSAHVCGRPVSHRALRTRSKRAQQQCLIHGTSGQGRRRCYTRIVFP